MPNCVMRCSGAELDVDAFLRQSSWKPCKVFRKGELKTHKGKVCEGSGFNLDVSTPRIEDFTAQVRQAIAFLKSQQTEIRRLSAFPGANDATLDFSFLFFEDMGFPSVRFPVELVKLAGDLGLRLEVTIYPGLRKDSENSNQSDTSRDRLSS